MSDEELDNVAGGGNIETGADSRFLNTLTGKCDRKTVGIEAEIYSFLFNGNTYKRMDNGQTLTQEEARQYAMNYVGKQMQKSDWCW